MHQDWIARRHRFGFTLVECLVFLSIWAAVSVTSLWIVRESTLMRGQARQRAELMLVAQSELERTRALPATELAAGEHLRQPRDWWPNDTSCTVALSPITTATWEVIVQVSRNTARSVQPVTLATIRKAAP